MSLLLNLRISEVAWEGMFMESILKKKYVTRIPEIESRGKFGFIIILITN